MRRIVPFTLAAIVLAALAAVAMAANSSSPGSSMRPWGGADAGAAAAAAAAPKGMHRLVLFDRVIAEEFVDVGEAGESTGDEYIFESRLFDRTRTKAVGRLSVSCQLRITSFACNGTAHLRGKGSIQVNGATFNADVYPVTGGTGRFADAGGQLRVTEVSATMSRLTFWLTP